MGLNSQIRLDDVNNEYKQFLEKFKPKKTTDDCYTPPNVYDAVLDWVVKEYRIDRTNIVRPFYPGGDYERHYYPEGCTVVDNPPFSILTEICKTYIKNGIKFFLFAPYLTVFSHSNKCICKIVCGAQIMYENGAIVDTAFVTNLDSEYEARTAPDLYAAVTEADKQNRKEKVRTLPKYEYPNEVLTASMLGYIGKYGIDYRVRHEDCYFVRSLNSQRKVGKAIYGAGFLLSKKAAAEKAAAEKWKLDADELAIIENLGGAANDSETVS